MKRLSKSFTVFALVAAFLAMATAMVLPHSHLLGKRRHGADGRAHACWMCQARAVGVSTPVVGPSVGPAQASAPAPQFVAPAPRSLTLFSLQEARAPPSAFSVSP